MNEAKLHELFQPCFINDPPLPPSFYAVYNLMSRTEMELFPYNPTTTSPLITPLGEGEIYTNGDGLGMILNDNGNITALHNLCRLIYTDLLGGSGL